MKKRRALLAAKYKQDENGEYVLDEKGKRIVEATVKLTPARDGERIWTRVDGTYLGGIGKAGDLMLKREAPAWLPKRLQEIAAAPDEECRLYGQTTGTCSCCGAELTNSKSIELGIGPICRAKWGLA